MDTRLNYPETIKKILTDFAETYTHSGGPPLKILCDDEQKSYMLLNIGWRGNKYIHSATVHIEIIDNKIWIQNDHTEEGIAAELVEAGIPKENIVLGFVIPKYGSTPNFQQHDDRHSDSAKDHEGF